MKRILLPLDGSALADRAVPFAATIATRAGWSLLLLRAVNTLAAPTERAAHALRDEAQAALDATAATLLADGVRVTTRVVDGQPESVILEATADADVGLVVMSTHGRGGLGRFIYGSVADTVLRHAQVPVLIVPPHGLDTWPPDQSIKVMVPLDGSDVSRAALGPAVDLADLLGGSLLLTSVVTFPTYATYAEGYVYAGPDPNDSILAQMRQELEALARSLQTDRRSVEICAIYGSPYFSLTAIAREMRVGLVVMATHGRSGVTRAVLGSVATSLVRQTDVPVVLVRPDAVAETPKPEAPTMEPAAPSDRPDPVTTVTLALSTEELDMLTRVVGERFYREPVDPRWAEAMRLLLEKLRTARPETPRPGSGERLEPEPAPTVP